MRNKTGLSYEIHTQRTSSNLKNDILNSALSLYEG